MPAKRTPPGPPHRGPGRVYPGLGPCHEFRTVELPALRRRRKRAGRAHVLAAQAGHYKTGFKRRERLLLWQPAGGGSFLSTPLSTAYCRGVS